MRIVIEKYYHYRIIQIILSFFPPFWFGAIATTVSPFVFINKKWLDQAHPEEVYVLKQHETVHILQQKQHGLLRFLWRYVTSKEYRFIVEYYAYLYDLKHLIDDLEYDNYTAAGMIATVMSSATYGNMCTYEYAYEYLRAAIANGILDHLPKYN